MKKPQKKSLKRHSSKKPAEPDFNETAQKLVRQSTETSGPVEVSEADIKRVMRALGSRGGKKGGVARMALLTEAERSDLASKAGHARWSGSKRAAG